MNDHQLFSKFVGRICALAGSLLVLAVCAQTAFSQAPSPKRTALVVGNSKYESEVGALKNPANDARAMSRALRSLGFVVTERRDLHRDALLETISTFRKTIPDSEIALFYYAGHGMAVAGSNYLIPIKSGFNLSNPDAETLKMQAETRLFNAEQLVADMGSGGAQCTLIILDTCRSLPLLQSARTRSLVIGGQMLGMTPPSGSLIAFSTDSGRVAFDGQGANGLYTEELLKQMMRPGLTVEQVFKKTRAAVMEKSGGNQIPAEYSRLVGEDIYLAGTHTPPALETPTSVPETKPPANVEELLSMAKSGKPEECLTKLSEVENLTPDTAFQIFQTLLERVKVDLRGLDSPTPNVVSAEKTCAEILKRLPEFFSSNSAQYKALASKAWNRRGDALLLLGRPEEALKNFNEALPLATSDAYIYLNRGKAHIALGDKTAAKADFLAASNPHLNQPKARELALQALQTLED